MALHVGAALVGFGAVALAGAYAWPAARRLERPGVLEETARFFAARAVAEWALLAVPVLGVAAEAADPGGGGLGRLWVGIALVLWACAAVAALGVGRPARARLRLALAPVEARDGAGTRAGTDVRGGADVAGAASAARRLAWSSAFCDTVFVLAVLDMVFRPR